MAKSQRSSRQKALRTQRAQRSAEWVAAAEAKRLEALQQCMESAPAEIVSTTAVIDDDKQQRGRDGAAVDTAMAVEQQQQPTKSSKKGKKKGVSVAKGIKKKKGAKAILAAQFSKKQRKQRR